MLKKCKSKACILLYLVTPEGVFVSMSEEHKCKFESFNGSWAGTIKAAFWATLAFIPALALPVI